MDRDNEGLKRRMSDATAASDETDESSTEEQVYVVRDGAVPAVDDDQIERVNDRESLVKEDQASLEGHLTGMDAELNRPPDLPETVEVSGVSPDGSSVGRGSLTDPTGATIGGDSPADEFDARAGGLGGDALGGSRLDPLGMLDSSDIGSPTDREIKQAISRADGSALSKGTEPAPPPGGGADPGDGEDPSRADDLNEKWSPKPPGERDGGGTRPGGGGDEPSGNDQPDGGDVTDEEDRPDPNAGYDVVTGENIDEALRVQGIAPYSQPTQDDDSSGAVRSVNLDWAAPGSDPRLTQYGPDGPPAVGADASAVAPQTDGIFDPPPETAAVGMAGAAGSMADPGAAVGGGDVIGSSTPEGEPDPPPTPPGEDPGDDPWAPPPGGGEG